MASETPAGLEPACSALQAGTQPLGHGVVRTLDWTRTSDTRLRKPVLYPLSYEGMVRVPGVEPGMPAGGSFTGCWTCRRPRRAWYGWPESNRRDRVHNPALYTELQPRVRRGCRTPGLLGVDQLLFH